MLIRYGWRLFHPRIYRSRIAVLGGERCETRHAMGLIALWCYWIEVGRRDSTDERKKNVLKGGA